MPGKTRKQADSPILTPLHLLQTLTRTLSEHLGQACSQAQEDAQKALDKLDREQQKLTDKLAQSEAKLAAEDAPDSGKSVERLHSKIAELNSELEVLNQARQQAQDYIRQLNNDVRQTLRLARGLERIEGQAGQAIEKRNNPASTASGGQRRSRSRKPAATPADDTAQSQD